MEIRKKLEKTFTVPILFEVSPSPPQLYNTIRGITDQFGTNPSLYSSSSFDSRMRQRHTSI